MECISNARLKVTCRDYYCYKFQIRPGHNNILLLSGRLFQQYVVDMYVKVETGRLRFLKDNQRHIRADLYQGLLDSLQMGHTTGSDVGKRVILPATFIGGPRDMQKRYLDAMALVRRYGKPDYFITMTCNPNWPEIQNELEPFELAQNRPDLTSRIFRAKLEYVKKKIIDRAFFGPVAAYVYVIEFQKRGLPHAHFLIILERPYKILTPEQVDKYVSAEIPPLEQHPVLHALVVKHMMHGPCGSLNPTNVCMNKKNKCKSAYPRDFEDATVFGNDSFPKYKRSPCGPTFTVRRCELDNRWVVPYNPLLLAELNCHINVEVCSSIKAVKYLYKYIYKGHDRVQFRLEDDATQVRVDEINEFREARWISPPEATWRIFAFPLNEMYPHVYSLQVHLPGYHHVTFKENSDLRMVLQLNMAAKSMLTEYFLLNQNDSFASSLLYKQLPEYFVWDKRLKVWHQRKKRRVIGRMMAVSPGEGERYYLRMLLSHVKGATSFEALRMVDSIVCGTFREACVLHGFLQDDNQYCLCLEEAAAYAMPGQLRHLFAIILAYCMPQEPRSLWLNFRTELTADFVYRGTNSLAANRLALADIQYLLEIMGKDINEYALVPEPVCVDLLERLDRVVAEEKELNIDPCDLAASQLLNPKQRLVFEQVMGAVDGKSSLMIFVDGPGGSGKTFLYKTLLAHIRHKGHIALATASSGVAAGILNGGRTAHYRFKIPLEVSQSMQCNVSKQSAIASLLKAATVIIWDEAPMMHRFCIESVDRLLQDLTGSLLPFGGKIVLLGGDFRQVLPIIPRASRSEVCQATLVNSYLWHLFEKKTLTDNMRTSEDLNYGSYLLRIGDGVDSVNNDNIICIPNDCLLPYENEENSLHQLLATVFPDMSNWINNCYLYINRVILTPKNDSVDNINNILVDEFPGDVRTYYSYDQPIESTEGTFDEDYLNTISLSGVPPHELKLKLNCPIMLLRNLNSAEGLSNGTRLICRRFHANLIEAEITDGQKKGQHVFLPRIPFVPAESIKNPYSFKRIQFPVRLCFAMTINKAQGQTLDYAGLYLPEPVFSHGQLYVALSRVKNLDSIKVLLSPALALLRNETKNIVFTEILQQCQST